MSQSGTDSGQSMEDILASIRRIIAEGEQDAKDKPGATAAPVPETAVPTPKADVFELTQVGQIQAKTNLLVLPQEAMGFGDVKLMAAVGAFLGWKPALFALMISSLLGSVVGLGLIALRLRELRGRIPYGPYIAAAAVLWVFYGRELVDWYMHLLIKE